MENIIKESEQSERIFSDEMRAKIIQAEKELQENPHGGITVDELKKRLAKI